MGGYEVSRRTVLAALSGAGVSAIANRANAKPSFAESWLEFGFDPGNTGHAPGHTEPSTPVGEQWDFDAAGTIAEAPAVIEDTVYIPAYDESDGGFLYALARTDLSERWAFRTGDRIFSSPTYRSGRVYVGSNDGNLYAIDAETGTESWRYSTSRDVAAPPKIDSGRLFVGTAEPGAENAIYALDAATGTEIWSASGYGWTKSGAIAGSRLVTGLASGIAALATRDGTELWTFTSDGFVDVEPCVSDGTAYVGCSDGITYAIDVVDGTERWRTETGVRIGTPPAIADGVVYLGDVAGVLYALDEGNDGEILWRFETDQELYSAPAVVGETVYIGSYDHRLYAIDKSTGTERWRVDAGDKVFSPVIADGRVYVGTGDGVAHVFGHGERARDGRSGRAPSTPSEEIILEATRTETTVGSPVTVQVAEPRGAHYRYEWGLTSAPEGSEAVPLHESSRATALTPDIPDEYELTVSVDREDGSAIGRSSIHIQAREDDLSTYGDRAGISTGGFESATVAELAEQFAPVLHFHGEERFFPTRVEGYVENADLRIDGGATTIATGPSLYDLGNASARGYSPGQESNRLYLPGDTEQLLNHQGSYPPTVYVSLTETSFDGDSYLALTYWCFYLLDPKKGDGTEEFDFSEEIAAFVSAHASDLETVTILFDSDGPQWVAGSQHESGTYVRWTKVARTVAPDRVDVYPALHAHSMFLVNTATYESQIPFQSRWLPTSKHTNRVVRSIAGLYGDVAERLLAEVFADETADARSVTPKTVDTGEDYDIVVLPEDEAWLDFEGLFTGDVATRQTSRAFHHLHSRRRTDPGPWIAGRMYAEPAILNAERFPDSIAFFNHDFDQEPTLDSFVIRSFDNPGLKPHTFAADIRIEVSDGTVENRLLSVPLGWDERRTIDIGLDGVELPSSGRVTVSVDIMTYEPEIADPGDTVYSVERTTVTDLVPEIELELSGISGRVSAGSSVGASTYYSVDATPRAPVVSPGEDVSMNVLAKNTGREGHDFVLSMVLEDNDGRTHGDDDVVGQSVRLEPREARTIELSWPVRTEIPEGVYDIVVEAWLESDPDARMNRLARRRQPRAVTVEKPDGRLEVETTPAGATVLADDMLLGESPLSTELPIGSYEISAFKRGRATATETVTVAEDRPSQVSLELEALNDTAHRNEGNALSTPETGDQRVEEQGLQSIPLEAIAAGGSVVAGLCYLALRRYHTE